MFGGAVLEVVLVVDELEVVLVVDELVASAVLVGLEDVVEPEVVVVREREVVLPSDGATDWWVVLGEVDADPPRIWRSHAASRAATPKRTKRRRVIQVGLGRVNEATVYRWARLDEPQHGGPAFRVCPASPLREDVYRLHA